jgi:hypothetical protein
MASRRDHSTLPVVELLGIEPAMLTNPEHSDVAPVVFVTLRPQPHQNWQSFSFPLSWRHAERLRDDLTDLLKRHQAPQQLN